MRPGDRVWVLAMVEKVEDDKVKVWVQGKIGRTFAICNPQDVREDEPPEAPPAV